MATLRHSIIAGRVVGAPTWLKVVVPLIGMGLIAMNAYHMQNYLVSKLTDHESWPVWIFMLQVTGISIACLEVPVTMAMASVWRERVHDQKSGFCMSVTLMSLLIVAVVWLAVLAGNSSQLADADRKDSAISSYQTSEANYENKRQLAKTTYEGDVRYAKSLDDAESSKWALYDAKQRYEAKLVQLGDDQANHQAAKPVVMMDTGSTIHTIAISVFSIVCSVGAVFCTWFAAQYITPLISLPSFSWSDLRSETRGGHSGYRDYSLPEYQTTTVTETKRIDSINESQALVAEEFNVSTRCPHCGEVNITDIVEIEKRNGTVMCQCGKGHVALTHLYDMDKKTYQQASSEQSGWKVTPAVGVGVGVSGDGLSPMAGIGAMISK